jgi:hypothetical protein
LDFFDVGGADAADGHFDEEIVRAYARDGDGLDAEVVGSAIDGGAHGFRNRKHAENLTTDDTDDTDILGELNREIRGTRGTGETESNQFYLSVYSVWSAV